MARLDLDRIVGNCVPDGGCLIWAGKVHYHNKGPQATEFVDGKDRYVSVRRRAYELYHKVTLDRLQLITAACGNPLCLSKKCLCVTSASERSRKGAARMTAERRLIRSRKQAQIQQARRGKMTPEIVQTILASEKGPYVIAKELGVNGTVASRIKRGVSWKQDAWHWGGLLAANDQQKERA